MLCLSPGVVHATGPLLWDPHPCSILCCERQHKAYSHEFLWKLSNSRLIAPPCITLRKWIGSLLSSSPSPLPRHSCFTPGGGY